MGTDINQQIEDTIANHSTVLFMKGTESQPMCGFSAQVVQVLNEHQVKFHAVDVLADEDLREGIKAFTNWPTIPQLYVKGEFVGGCDIVMQLHRDGKLQNILSAST